MSEYSIHIENGKIIGDSAFFLIANNLLGNESQHLCDFTDSLDKDPQRKKELIAEYKCAKYRYASVSLIHSIIYNNNCHRKQFNLEYSHYVLGFFDNLLKTHSEYLALYESATAKEKPDFSLYYSAMIFTENEIAELEEKISVANDWEKIELEERIGGLKFAKECLDEAWQRRKEVVK